MTGPTLIDPKDGATAALFAAASLAQTLAMKGILTTDELNFTFASAASMCRANGSEQAAIAIELLVPSSVGVDPVKFAAERGATINKA